MCGEFGYPCLVWPVLGDGWGRFLSLQLLPSVAWGFLEELRDGQNGGMDSQDAFLKFGWFLRVFVH